MQLTKTLEQAILKIYDTWMHSYLNGDVETYDSYFDNSYHFIGSTNNEEFLNRKDTTKFFKETAEQFAGKTDLRNQTTTLELFDELVFITHVFDAWFLNGEEWTYYSRFRFSSVLKKKKEGWKFIYQHFSIADSKTDEGETIGFDKVNLENQELREAIKRRTFELEEKNRELEVEGALERIRAQAVAMQQSSDLLDIVVTMRNEFIKLGHEAHYFWHMMWLPEKYEKAMTSGDGTKIGFVMELPRHIHGDIPLLAKWEKSKKPTVVYAMDVDEAIAYVEKMVTLGDFQNIDPQAPTEDDMRHIGGLTFIMARTSHGEIGYSLPGVVKNPPKEDIGILVKFASAFDLAHRRFLDLKKAEKQRREVEIELALEKVRSRTMGMQRSDELRDTAMLLFQQVEELGINSFACGFNIWDDNKKFATAWMASKDRLQPPFRTNSSEDVYLLFHEAEKRGDALYVLQQEGKELEEHYRYLVSIPEVKALAKAGLSFPTFQIIHCAYFSKGYLMFITHQPVPDAHDIFKRFAKVFEQTYTRFLDLQKAEKQARESEIELALERVRARTMAMQHSDELQEASFLLDEQVRNLGIKTWGCAFNIYGENESTEWFGNEAGVLPTYTVPRTGIFKKYYDKGQKGETLWIEEFSGKACVAHYETMSALPVIGDVLLQLKETNNGFPTYQLDHVVYFKYGYLLFITREHVPEAHDIFKRFAKVFQQTYTRFLDLQKAEAQAREAQIEASLERVRASAMAMHKSDDLGTCVDIVFSELGKLGFNTVRCGIGIFNDQSNRVNVWTTSSNKNKDVSQLSGDELLEGHPLLDGIYAAWKAQIDYSYTLKGNDLKDYYKAVSDSNLPVSGPENNTSENQYYHLVNFPAGGLFAFNDSAFKLEEKLLMKRFGEVFHLSFTRHLDLKQAEAQAREAQIEAALERVRSQSMGMQTSLDLSNVTTEMFKQLRLFNGDLFATGIVFCDKHEGHVEQWHSIPEAGMMSPFIVPIDLDYIHQYRYDQWKQGSELFSIEIPSDFIEQHFQDIFNLPSAQKVLKDFEDQNTPMPGAPTWEIDYGASFKHGYLLVSSLQAFEEAEILPRFAKVFEQTYTRFLDLQKVEAQAREAEIELALERIRARTMAMQKSEELKDVIQIVFNQFINLNIHVEHTGFIIDYKVNDDMHIWLADQLEVPSRVTVPYFDTPNWNSFNEAKEKGNDFFISHYTFKEKNKFYKKLFQLIPGIPKDAQDYYFKCPGLDISGVLLEDVGLYIEHFSGIPYSEEENAILMRFGKVFQQTYTRFLDLQKAEAQAREAQIEVSLERVRARAMAMHQTDELTDVLCVLFDQFDILGINPVLTHLTLMDEENETFSLRITTTAENRIVAEQFIDINAVEAWKISYANWKKSEPNAIDCIDYLPEVIPMVWELLSEVMEALPKGHKIYPKDFPDGLYTTQGHFKFGYIGFNHSRRATEEEKTIVVRFAKEFGRTYQRFLDLEKAEAQAREAQIETALEKVRSRSLAMQKSDELLDVIGIVSKQINALGLKFDTICFGENNKEGAVKFWLTSKGLPKPILIDVPPIKNKAVERVVKAQKDDLKFLADVVTRKTYTEWNNHMLTHSQLQDLPEAAKTYLAETSGFARSSFFLKEIALYVMNYKIEPFSYADNAIFNRFAQVFDQSYTRFLDLQKAEAQAREAQIEMALEKVRSRTMAMQQSEELPEAANNLFLQVQELGIPAWSAGYCIWEDEKKKSTWCNMSSEGEIQKPFSLPTIGEGYNFAEPLKNSESFHVDELGGKALVKHYDFMKTLPVVGEILKDFDQKGIDLPTFQIFHIVYFTHGYLMFITYEPVQKDWAIFKRFGKIFEQTFTRFLDLQKAESQAREAQIETALEKVRSRSMAMHTSEELLDVITVVSEQLRQLEFKFSHVSFANNNIEGDYKFWVSAKGQLKPMRFNVPYLDLAVFNNLRAAQNNSKPFFTDIITKTEHNQWHSHLLNHVGSDVFSKQDNDYIMSKGMARSMAINPNIVLILANYASIPFTEDENKIIERFGQVFEQSYTRFLDLQKAESQTRTAQINLAVERVRAKALAMHKSEEIMDVVAKLKDEVMSLDIPDVVAATIFLKEGEDNVRMWDLSSLEKDNNGYEVPFDITFKLKKTDPHLYVKRVWENTADYFIEKQNQKDFKRIIAWLRENNQIKVADEVEDYTESTQLKQLYHAVKKLNNGKLVIDLMNPPSEEMETILTKMGAAFDLAYQRFEDLKKAEAQTREALIEASLERVRSRTLAMQNSDELAETSVVVFQQLIELGIAPNRLFIGIIKDNDSTIEAWATNEDGSKIEQHFKLNPSKNKSIKKILDGWKQKNTTLVIDMKGKELQSYFQYLNEEMDIPFIHGLEQKRRVQTIAYFSGGLIGMAAPVEQPKATIELLERFASVFNLTYTRFNDLKVAEAQSKQAEEDLVNLQKAKKRAEETLSDLQATQKQLIQSEKMASLGELTAGIAHEIQNPLNFVNNFSEVSKELLEEMLEEIENGDMEEVRAIMADVIQNLDKINHHGKRADGIVKGMLQHSRASGDKKEPTNINALADEYLRLAYHGLRAKNKSFNAQLVTDFDTAITSVNVIPQDMGRVILNLLTNAFYAVNERQKEQTGTYEPTVSIATKKKKNTVEIKVTDNGNGMPDSVKEKIFQPFFTTKPTGQGTGLGLSMSYDIITKGHGGELKVKSAEGKGTIFIIELPNE